MCGADFSVIGQGKRAFIQGPANDAAVEADPGQLTNVGGRGHAARSNHRHFDGGVHFGHRREVRALEHAVAGNIGVDDRRQRLGGELKGQFDGAGAARVQPAVGGHEAPFGVDS